MRYVVLAVALFAPRAWSEPPMPNPLLPNETNEFPPPPPEKPQPPRGVPRAGFFALAAGTIACGIFSGVMTGIVASEPQMQNPTPQAQTESLMLTAGWTLTALLAVATVLVGFVTRWSD
jgi:hypothetical protein